MTDFSSVQKNMEIGFGNGKHLSGYFDLNPELTITGIDFPEYMCEEAEDFIQILSKMRD